jgi:transient receptor potential cation channel subfamily M member 2
MLTAIHENRTEFVQLFLENGLSLKKFLTYKKLLELYKKVSNKSDLYRLLLKKHGNIEDLDFISIGRVIQNLINDLFKHRYTFKNYHEVSHIL